MSITLGEIRDQYNAIRRTIELFDEKKQQIMQFVGVPRCIVLTGCGSSFSLSCTVRSMASMRLNYPVYALASGDLWLNCARYQNMLKDALIISLSRSGRTSELLRAYEAVKKLNVGARFMSLICDDDTPAQAASDFALCMKWAFDKSVCQTRCVSNLYTAGALLIGLLSGDESIRAGIEKAACMGEAYMDKCIPQIQKLCEEDWDRVVVLADGEIDGLAEEGALAFNEISQLGSNCYHILDVRHGPMVLIGKKTLVIAAVKSPKCGYEMALVDDVLKKGARVCCYSNLPLEKEGVLGFSLGEEVGPVAGGLGLIALCQLTSYYKSFQVGCNPDLPDGLDPWIEIR